MFFSFLRALCSAQLLPIGIAPELLEGAVSHSSAGVRKCVPSLGLGRGFEASGTQHRLWLLLYSSPVPLIASGHACPSLGKEVWHTPEPVNH